MKFMYSEDQAHSPYSSGHDRRCPTSAKTSNLEAAEPLKSRGLRKQTAHETFLERFSKDCLLGELLGLSLPKSGLLRYFML
jgi:hypothetical protein